MARGGARKNAGRPAGPLTKLTREIARKAIEEGLSPLDVALDNMRYFHAEAVAAEKLTAERTAIDTEADPAEAFNALLAEVKKAVGFRMLAGANAKIAAPYIHPQLVAVEAGKPKDAVAPLHERIAAMTREDAIKASSNVVELKKGKRK